MGMKAGIGGPHSLAVLQKAQVIIERALQLLQDPVCEEQAIPKAPFESARAQARCVLEQLSRMVESHIH
jgi:hypothetical protein